MQKIKRTVIKIEDLVDLGLNPKEASRYIEYDNSLLNNEKKLKLLKNIRCRLLHMMHEEQKKIDKVDYLIYEINKGEKMKKIEPLFGLGDFNNEYKEFFSGKSFINLLNNKDIQIINVTFEKTCRNNWHIHHKGGQILLCTDGIGWYQESGMKARKLFPGDVVYIAPETKHWHGAAKDGNFSHVAISIPAEGQTNEWLEPVTDEEYNKLD